MHERYPSVVADLLSQTRDLLVEIAYTRKRLRHKDSGFINESAYARALGVRSTTVHRILHLKRRPALSEWAPSHKLLSGLVSVAGYDDEGEALAAIQAARAQPDDILRELIRPRKPRRRRR